MTTLITLGGILVLLALGFWWVVRTGKRLNQAEDNPKRAVALHGASLPREFHRQDMEKIFKKKIKTRFPILFKRAVEFQMLKAQSRLR